MYMKVTSAAQPLLRHTVKGGMHHKLALSFKVNTRLGSFETIEKCISVFVGAGICYARIILW
jgi:hypothetical protein